jgi:ParB/Sulfiredoxin domain
MLIGQMKARQLIPSPTGRPLAQSPDWAFAFLEETMSLAAPTNPNLASGNSPPNSPPKGLAISVDPEFQTLIAPLSAQEFDLLKGQILERGCLEPLYVWKTDAGRILLDGHNRLEICTRFQKSYTTVNIKLDSRDEAKLWILEHQAGRRNLTDDQRAVIWNEIREARSAIVKAERSAKANAARAATSSLSVKIDDKVTPVVPPVVPPSKKDTRAAVAEEAKLPENKLKVAQTLKKYQPELYKAVLSGQVTLRTAKSRTRGSVKPARRDYSEKDFYARVGRTLHNLYKTNRVDEYFAEIVAIKKDDWCPAAVQGIVRLRLNLDDISKQTKKYSDALVRVLKAHNEGR